MTPWTVTEDTPFAPGPFGLPERTVQPQLREVPRQAREQSGHHRYPSRRFLLPPGAAPATATRIQLGWMSSDPSLGSEVQLIEDGPGGTLKVTSLSSVLWQQPVTRLVAQAMLDNCDLRLDVERWLYQPGNLHEPGRYGRWRVSHYPRIGLMTARLEGPSPETLPEGLGTEVTGDGRYRPDWIARHGRPDPQGQAQWRELIGSDGRRALDLVEVGPQGERRLNPSQLRWHLHLD